MCGRFVRKKSTSEIADEFEVQDVLVDFQPSFNIAPTQDATVIIEDGSRRLTGMRWGLVPAWAADPAIGNKLINARSETLSQTRAFREAFQKRRCLIPADGFYEWKKQGKISTPMMIRLASEETFAFAALYEIWNPSQGEPLMSFTIVTTEATESLRAIHDRMPVILAKEARNLWLDWSVSDYDRLSELFKPYPSDEIKAYAVSHLVNSVKNDIPACIEPATETQLGLPF